MLYPGTEYTRLLLLTDTTQFIVLKLLTFSSVNISPVALICIMNKSEVYYFSNLEKPWNKKIYCFDKIMTNETFHLFNMTLIFVLVAIIKVPWWWLVNIRHLFLHRFWSLKNEIKVPACQVLVRTLFLEGRLGLTVSSQGRSRDRGYMFSGTCIFKNKGTDPAYEGPILIASQRLTSNIITLRARIPTDTFKETQASSP